MGKSITENGRTIILMGMERKHFRTEQTMQENSKMVFVMGRERKQSLTEAVIPGWGRTTRQSVMEMVLWCIPTKASMKGNLETIYPKAKGSLIILMEVATLAN